MSEVFVSTGNGPWKSIGYLNNCEACPTSMPPFNTESARYEWWPRSGPWCPTLLCVECCAKWRAEVEARTRKPPRRISEICSAWTDQVTTGPAV